MIYSVDSIRSPLKTDVRTPLQYRAWFMDTSDSNSMPRRHELSLFCPCLSRPCVSHSSPVWIYISLVLIHTRTILKPELPTPIRVLVGPLGLSARKPSQFIFVGRGVLQLDLSVLMPESVDGTSGADCTLQIGRKVGWHSTMVKFGKAFRSVSNSCVRCAY